LLAVGAKEVIIVDGFPRVDLTKSWMETMAAGAGFPDLKADNVAPFTPLKSGSEFCLYKQPVAIHPGCSDVDRMWPAYSFAAIINRLLKLQQPVLCWPAQMTKNNFNWYINNLYLRRNRGCSPS
jgi:hypothetical protein